MLEINVPTVQQQFGSCDCGLFAVAFMLHLTMGDDPQHILFEQSQMRSISSSQVLPVPKEDGTISAQESRFYPNRECTFLPICDIRTFLYMSHAGDLR